MKLTFGKLGKERVWLAWKVLRGWPVVAGPITIPVREALHFKRLGLGAGATLDFTPPDESST